MFLSKIRNSISNLEYALGRHLEYGNKGNETKILELKEKVLDLDCKIDLLRLESVRLSDMRVIFEDLAKKELEDINSKIDRARVIYEEVENKDREQYHIFYLAVNGVDIEIYSDLKLMKEYEFSEIANRTLKSDIVRRAFVLYMATKILKDRVGLIKDLIQIKCNSAYMSVEDKKMEILERIKK